MIKETKSLFKKTKNGIDFFCEAQYDRYIEFLTTFTERKNISHDEHDYPTRPRHYYQIKTI